MVYQKGQKAPKWSTTRCTPILIYTSTSKYRRARLYLDVDVFIKIGVHRARLYLDVDVFIKIGVHRKVDHFDAF